jgi:hypothetical protein
MNVLLYIAFGFAAVALQQNAQPPAVPPASPGIAAEAGQQPAQTPTLAPNDLPVSLRRIQRALSHPPALKLSGDRTVFRVEVIGRKPTIEDILGPDYLKGPAPATGAMSHQEFLNMVTPRDVQGYAAFSNKEGFVVAATSIALQWALQKAIHKLKTAKQDREREAARAEVQDALAELARARLRAGLPPK